MRAADVAPVFADYEAFLRRALPQAEERQARNPPPVRPAGPFPVAVQEALCRRLSERLGPGLRPCAAGPFGASVLRRHADRRAHHHALRRGRLHPGGARRGARDRPRAVRARPARRLGAPAGRRGGRHGGARKPVADRRDAGLPVGRLPDLARARSCTRPSAAIRRPIGRTTSRGCGGASSAASSASTPMR